MFNYLLFAYVNEAVMHLFFQVDETRKQTNIFKYILINFTQKEIFSDLKENKRNIGIQN